MTIVITHYLCQIGQSKILLIINELDEKGGMVGMMDITIIVKSGLQLCNTWYA